jgi:CHAT domain-containing protein
MDEHHIINKYLSEFIDSARAYNIPDSASFARTLSILGINLGTIGQYAEAEELLLESLSIYDKIKLPEPWLLSKATNLAGIFYLSIGRYVESEYFFKESIKAIKSNADYQTRRRGDYWNRLFNISGLYLAQDKLEEAERYLSEADSINKTVNEISRIMTSQNIADLNIKKGKYREADSLFQYILHEYYSMYPANHYYVLQAEKNLSLLYLRMGDIDKAEKLIVKFFKNSLDKPWNIQLCDLIFSKVDFEWHYSELNDLNNLKDLTTKNNVDSLFTNLFNILKNTLENNTSSFSEVEKSDLWNTLQDYYEIYNTYVVEHILKNPELASSMYDNRLFIKANLLNTSKKVREKILNSGDSELISLFQKWQSYRDELAKLYQISINEPAKFKKPIDSLKSLSNNYEKQFTKLSANKFRDQLNESQNISWRAIKSCLRDDEAAIEIVRFREYSLASDKFNQSAKIPQYVDSVIYAALIVTNKTKNVPTLVLLKNGKELESKNLLNKYESLNKVNQQVNPLSKEDNDLYSKLWEPIAKNLPGIEKVFLSTDGIYSIINLQTIFNPNTMRYLFDDFDIQVVTTTKDIIGELRRNNPKINKTAELFGNPDFDLSPGLIKPHKGNLALRTRGGGYKEMNLDSIIRTEDWEPLPSTKEEIDFIGKILKKEGWNVNKHSGADASEEKIKSISSPGILHIASHAAFYPDSTLNSGNSSRQYYERALLRSYIILAGANKYYNRTYLPDNVDDGRLTAFESMNLNLENTELAVLSACETGLGDVKFGEGVYGLQRCLQIAGVKSLIMSLWKIPDDDTKELMKKFYEKWLKDKKPKRAAFKEAQKELKSKKWSTPSSWGAFLMLGN